MNVAINGFGRIGRAFFRQTWGRSDMHVVAINDLGSPESLAYLLQYDSVYREKLFQVHVVKEENAVYLVIRPNPEFYIGKSAEERKIRVCSEKDPAALPWKEFNIDVVVESTGFFTKYDQAHAHIIAGARRVVISAPAQLGADTSQAGEMVVLNANEERFVHASVTSNASCTTNAANPLVVILDEALGIQKAVLNTVHAYTASQSLVDGPSKKDLREGRGAAQNIVPSSTGAAQAVGQVYSKLKDKFDGISLRVPVPAGSIVDVTFIASRDTTREEVNAFLKEAAISQKWKGIFTASDDPLVSSDIVGNTHACIADLEMTRVVGGNLVKVLGWYDNEMGYTATLVSHVIKAGSITQ
jgi:glyceraldehyde 3-phosphate dehydrogenase